MGLSLEFHLGDAEKIIRAVAEIEPEKLYDPQVVTHSADFSLHIEPADLDLLSEVIGVASSQPPRKLGLALEGVVDEPDRGALMVGSDWLGYVAALPIRAVPDVTTQWATAMCQKYGVSDIVPNDGMRAAIQNLVLLCQAAVANNGQVVHIWYL